MAKVRIELDSDGIKKFLQTDPGIREDLQRRVDAVVQRAGEEHHDGSVWVGGDRQRGTVRTTSTAAARDEAVNHTLLKAVDGAR